MSKANQEWILPAWCRKLNISTYHYNEWKSLKLKNDFQNILTNPGLDKMYQQIFKLSKDLNHSFLQCSSSFAFDFVNKNIPQTETIEQNLQNELIISQNQSPSSQQMKQNHKNIMLVGRTTEGKTTLIKQLMRFMNSSENEALFQTDFVQLYQLEALQFNFLDTQSLDEKEDNQIVLNSVMEDFIIHTKGKPQIDAIIVMWCPIKNGRSGLMKTLQNLRVAYGEKVLETCIVMIQGNWKPFADMLRLTDAVNEAVKEIQEEFPEMPIIEYDAKEPANSKINVHDLMTKVQPYQIEDFEKKQKEDFFDMMTAISAKESKICLIKRKENVNFSLKEVNLFELAKTSLTSIWDAVTEPFLSCVTR